MKPLFSSWKGKLVDNRNLNLVQYAEVKEVEFPHQYDGARVAGFIGWDGLVVMDEKASVVDMAHAYLSEVQKLCCGECTVGWLGISLMVTTLGRILDGEGREEDIELLERLGKWIKENAKCHLGQTAPVPVLDTIQYYKEEYVDLIRGKKTAPKSTYKTLVSAPCMEACPAHLDIPGYIELIRNRRNIGSLNSIRKGVCLPGTCGRVCPAPCEDNCTRKDIDVPVAIRALKRYVADWELEQGLAPAISKAKEREKRVAIVGAGPAGLACGSNLALKGYQVTIFEELPVAGGMAAVGIPQYRLPKDILNQDIALIERMGVDIRLNTRIGRDITIPDLWREGYKAIFIAVGAHQGRKIEAEGEDQGYEGFIDGVKFLRDLNLGKKIEPKDKVLVIGGGDVAIDCARSCLRLGFKEVNILYRRSRVEMPARKEEVEEAEKEGVKLNYLVTPTKILAKNGKVAGAECIRMELGEPDESGRRRPIPIKGSEFVIEADVIIPAIGQAPDLSFLTHNQVEVTKGMTVKADPDTCQTSEEGIFSGGDCVTGPAVLIDALAAGNRAAESIDQFLREGKVAKPEEAKFKAAIQGIDLSHQREKGISEKKAPQSMWHTPVEERIYNFAEVERGLTPQAALEEAKRCLRCYRVMLLALAE